MTLGPLLGGDFLHSVSLSTTNFHSPPLKGREQIAVSAKGIQSPFPFKGGSGEILESTSDLAFPVNPPSLKKDEQPPPKPPSVNILT